MPKVRIAMSRTETSAPPSDVRKGSAFPERFTSILVADSRLVSNQRGKGNQRNFVGKAKPYRTSGGRAAHVLRIPSVQIEVVNQLHIGRDRPAVSRCGLKANQLGGGHSFFSQAATQCLHRVNVCDLTVLGKDDAKNYRAGDGAFACFFRVLRLGLEQNPRVRRQFRASEDSIHLIVRIIAGRTSFAAATAFVVATTDVAFPSGTKAVIFAFANSGSLAGADSATFARSIRSRRRL